MVERGVVTRIVSPGVVEVSLPEQEGCAGCGACRHGEAGAVCIEAVNAAGAGIGDAVQVEVAVAGVVQSSAIVYLLPIFALLAGYGVGSVAARWVPDLSGETGGIAGGMIGLAFSFLVVRWYDRRAGRQRAVRATVTKILTPGTPSAGEGAGIQGTSGT